MKHTPWSSKFTAIGHPLSLSIPFDSSPSSSLATCRMTGSTAPSISPKRRGNCVVCGKKTDKMCSDCRKHGTDWIYFCSNEHSKLVSTSPRSYRPSQMLIDRQQVWELHKGVCGKRSNPFRWPGLTGDKMNRMYGDARDEYNRADGSKTTWLKENKLDRRDFYVKSFKHSGLAISR